MSCKMSPTSKPVHSSLQSQDDGILSVTGRVCNVLFLGSFEHAHNLTSGPFNTLCIEVAPTPFSSRVSTEVGTVTVTPLLWVLQWKMKYE